MSGEVDFAKLSAPFPASDVEWRIAERGKKKEGGQWARVLAYITNRAIMQRLDEVCGPAGWRNEFQALDGAFLCGIGIKIDGEWVMKWDGAQESNIEATKGGISGAMKRAAVQWGIGRYLYQLEAGWAKIHDGGQHYAGKDTKKNLDAMKWDPPELPSWALPGKGAVAPPQNSKAASAPVPNGNGGNGSTKKKAALADEETLGKLSEAIKIHGISVAEIKARCKAAYGVDTSAKLEKPQVFELIQWMEQQAPDARP